MSLSLWECSAAGCPATCVGQGGAVGLRAIGWYFVGGPFLYCPRHRPDTRDCRQKPGNDCPQCTGEIETRRLQPKLMTDAEQDDYLRNVLPIMQRQDLEIAVRAADGRPNPGVDHFPLPLCEHGVWKYGACKNADCPNCADNLIPGLGPLAPPEYRPGWSGDGVQA